jgi:hypothetical protein
MKFQSRTSFFIVIIVIALFFDYTIKIKKCSLSRIKAIVASDDVIKDATIQSTNDAFDKVLEILYKRATIPDETSRKEFTLDGWSRGKGGLVDDDRILLGKLYFHANSVFEYGLGESTYIAGYVGVPRYAGVDSDAVWVADARTNSKMSHFRFYFADIGETKLWGYPVDVTLQKIQYDYQLAPLRAETKPFDIYLVDGRYRVACMCISFLHAMKHRGDMSKVMVGIHDNDDPNRGYNAIQRVAEIVEHTKKLWVYKLKPGIIDQDIYQLWMEYENNPQRL